VILIMLIDHSLRLGSYVGAFLPPGEILGSIGLTSYQFLVGIVNPPISEHHSISTQKANNCIKQLSSINFVHVFKFKKILLSSAIPQILDAQSRQDAAEFIRTVYFWNEIFSG